MARMTIHITEKKKNHSCITCINCINSFIAYHKNYLEIIMVAMVCMIPKSDLWIERYHEIKFSWSTCVDWGEIDHVLLIEINFDWLVLKIN